MRMSRNKRMRMSRNKRYQYLRQCKRRNTVDNNSSKISAISYQDYVLINKGELEILSKYILDHKNIETGGQLFGYWTYDGNPVVLFVLGPGPNAGHYKSFFMQDIDYLKERASWLKAKFGLDHIGEWHSHHQLGLPFPSGHDANNLSNNIRKLGYSKFLLCIGSCTGGESFVNAYMFYSDRTSYNCVPWKIKDIDSPFRRIMSPTEQLNFILPKTEKSNMGQLYLKNAPSVQNRINYTETYWLKQKGNAKNLKAIIDALGELYPDRVCIPTIDSDNEAHLELYSDNIIIEDIHFPKAFPIESPLICDSNGNILSKSAEWKFEGDILKSFVTYYKSLKINKYDER